MLAVSIALISVSSVFSVSAAEIEENQDGSLTLTERYNADSTDEKFEFESEIEYGSKMYALNTDSVTAEVLSETPELETKHETYEESSIGYTEVTEAEDKEVVNEEDGETYFYCGGSRLKVREHFAGMGKPVGSLIESVIDYTAQ